MTKFYPGWAEREPIPPEPRPSPRAMRKLLEDDAPEPEDDKSSKPVWCQRGAEWYIGGTRKKKTTAT